MAHTSPPLLPTHPPRVSTPGRARCSSAARPGAGPRARQGAGDARGGPAAQPRRRACRHGDVPPGPTARTSASTTPVATTWVRLVRRTVQVRCAVLRVSTTYDVAPRAVRPAHTVARDGHVRRLRRCGDPRDRDAACRPEWAGEVVPADLHLDVVGAPGHGGDAGRAAGITGRGVPGRRADLAPTNSPRAHGLPVPRGHDVLRGVAQPHGFRARPGDVAVEDLRHLG